MTLVYISVCGRRVSLLASTHGQWHSCTFQCAAGVCQFLHQWPCDTRTHFSVGRRVPLLAPWPVTLMYVSVCGRCLWLLAPVASDTRVHFSMGPEYMPFLAHQASDTRVHFSLRQALAISCSHGQCHSCTFQCVTGACRFLHPWSATLVFTSVCDSRVLYLAPMASDTRVNFGVRQARATSCNKWLAYISACATADTADWSRNDLNKSTNRCASVISRRMLENPTENRFRMTGFLQWIFQDDISTCGKFSQIF